MPSTPCFPSLYQINSRIWLREISRNNGRCANFDEIDEGRLDSIAFLGFDWVWLLGVWQTGETSRAISRSDAQWQEEFKRTLPDLKEDDICGSPFAIKNYTVHTDFGGDQSLARLRERMKPRGLKLLLDFVPNHTALDHPWVFDHPEYYIAGSEDDLYREAHNYKRVETSRGPRIIAHGRDPYFPGWPDTFQLNYRSSALREAMIGELERIATQCDGVRCDMAMLPLPDVIQRTWAGRAMPSDGTPPITESFWPEAIRRVRAINPDFVFMAEVYWDREWELQQQGFDYTYDKRLYDRLHAHQAEAIRGHLCADPDFQRKSVRFLENHDEPRAASAFQPAVHRAAAAIAFLVPGMRFIHEGELEGRQQRVSMHLGRRPNEPIDMDLRAFYLKLFSVLKLPIVRDGQWKLLDCKPAWDGNHAFQKFIVFSWEIAASRMLVAVNFSGEAGQCLIPLPWPEIAGKTVVLNDLLGSAVYERDGNALKDLGLYLDVPAWQAHVFEVRLK